ncbi:hypothetical protein ACFOEE_12675 [Pseudoalteromonas fenneropenaei]|uniref:CHASE2 domain-containing protein n=1 Tax=Pseudoalteromonas fenneropenaei TaxID=1737459 RepID=A0ABV7CL38_9GAMM
MPSILSQLTTLLQRRKGIWFSVILLLAVFSSEPNRWFGKVDATLYTAYNHLNQSPWLASRLTTPEVVSIESDVLYREHIDIVSALASYPVKAVIVLSNATLAGVSSLPNTYYPLQTEQLCLPAPTVWYGAMGAYQPDADNCRNVWQTLYPERDHQQTQLLNFQTPIGQIPKFTAKRLLAGDVLPTQLANKVVIVSQSHNRLVLPLTISLLPNSHDPSILYAYLADNLAKQQLITITPRVWHLSSTLVLVLLLLFCYQQLQVRKAFLVAILASTLALLSSATVFITLQHLLPAGSWLIYIWLIFILVFLNQKLRDERHLLDLIALVQERMMGRYLPKAFTARDNPWDAIVVMVRQQLDLQKTIFLARISTDHRLREIRAVGCNIDEITELRRDFEREPYASAIKAIGAIKVERTFFQHLAENEQQYLVPLMYAGDIRGFWAMTVRTDATFNESAFIRNVNRFASQIGELLFHFDLHTRQQQTQQHPLAKTLLLTINQPLSQQVRSAINEMEQKLNTLEQVFNHLHSAAILFNLFGQVVQTNAALERFANLHQLTIFDMTALDMLSKVTSLSHEEAKGKLRFITLHHGTLFLPVLLAQHKYILKISALDEKSASSSGNPFEIVGIVFEFLEMTELFANLNSPEILLNALCNNLQESSTDPTEAWS